MKNNPEITFINAAARIGRLKSAGVEFPGEHRVAHNFFDLNCSDSFRNELLQAGFMVSSRTSRPGWIAVKRETISEKSIRSIVDPVVKIANKYDVRYDGWFLADIERDDHK